MERIDNLTGVRAFAACWVVVHHLQENSVNRINLGPIADSGWLGVDIFFVLSGFVLSTVYAPRFGRFTLSWYRSFLIRRLAKIYPMHIITFLMMASLLGIAHQLHYALHSVSDNTWWSALCNVLMIHAFGVNKIQSWNVYSWSVSAEWFAYAFLLTPILIFLKRWKVLLLLLLTAALWGSYLWLALRVLHVRPVITNFGILRIIPEFVAGYTLFRCLPKISIPGDLLMIIGLILLVGAPAINSTLVFASMIPAIMLFLAGAAKRGTITNQLFGNRFVVLVGEGSYSIYLLQGFFLNFTNILMRKFPSTNPAVALGEQLLAGMAMVAGGVLVFLFIEEPIRQAILRRFLPQQREPAARIPAIEAPDTRVASTV
jgi:peptidoglycan/LPS O-acetylase OafA/YrhL